MKENKIKHKKKEDEKKIWQVIFASSVGTMIEWYDFYIFGTLASFIATQFYPKGNETVSYLATLATFATGFIVRPFGAIVFGHIGDKVGRKYTFLVTMLIMGGATFVIGILPGYDIVFFDWNLGTYRTRITSTHSGFSSWRRIRRSRYLHR